MNILKNLLIILFFISLKTYSSVDVTKQINKISNDDGSVLIDMPTSSGTLVLDSQIIPYVAPGASGNVLTSDGVDWISAAPSGGGANTSLSNLNNPTDISQNLISNIVNFTIQTQNQTGATASKALLINSGTTESANSGNITIKSGATSTLGDSGDVVIGSGVSVGSTKTSGDVNISTGAGEFTGAINIFSSNASVGASGNISIFTGTSGTVRGDITLDGEQINVVSHKIVNLATPTSGTDAANKNYVDGKVAGVASSVDSEIMLFSGTGGKTAKRATGTGVVHATSGVYSVANVNLASEVTGTLPVANGGTNSNTALSGSSIIISNGSSIVQGAAGTTTTVLHGNAGGAPTYSAVDLAADITGTLPVANGGTGATSLTANNVILGNGTSAVNFVAPGANGNVLTSNGTTWVSSAGGGSGCAPSYSEINSNITLADETNYVTAGALTLNLPAASSITCGIKIKKSDSNTLTIVPDGTDLLEGVNANLTVGGNLTGITIFCGTGKCWID